MNLTESYHPMATPLSRLGDFSTSLRQPYVSTQHVEIPESNVTPIKEHKGQNKTGLGYDINLVCPSRVFQDRNQYLFCQQDPYRWDDLFVFLSFGCAKKSKDVGSMYKHMPGKCPKITGAVFRGRSGKMINPLIFHAG